jgi:hypothetical protein
VNRYWDAADEETRNADKDVGEMRLKLAAVFA